MILLILITSTIYLTKYQFDGVIHLAAESHVDRSISNPLEFIQTNVVGTFNLLHAAKNHGVKISMVNCFIMYQQMKCMVL